MSQELLVALIGLGGVALGGALGGILQYFNTRQLLKGESARALRLSATEYENRMLERRFERCFEFVAELVSVSDPSIQSQLDYRHAVRLIAKTQLLLDCGAPLEARLNDKINHLGFALAIYTRSPDAKLNPEAVRSMEPLKAHGEVIDAAKALFLNWGQRVRQRTGEV